jgi:hypothetical protein
MLETREMNIFREIGGKSKVNLVRNQAIREHHEIQPVED